LNSFEINLIQFKTESGGTVLPGLRVSAALPHPPAPSHCPPGPHVVAPHLSAATPTSLTPTTSHVRSASAAPARRVPPATVRAAQSHHARAMPTHMAPHPGPPHLLLSCPHAASSRPPPFSLAAPCPSAFKSTYSSTSPPSPSTLDSVRRPQMSGSPWSPTHF
jgi:hypothetical protein